MNRAIANQIVVGCSVLLQEMIEESDGSSSEDEIEFLFSIQLLRGPMVLRPRVRNYLDVVALYSDAEFKSHFRIMRETFAHLLQLVAPSIEKQGSRAGRQTIPACQQLLLAIWMMATPDSYRSVCDKFNVGRATALRSVRRVTNALYRAAPSIIRWPTRIEAERTSTVLKQRYKFPKVVGAMDGTHIQITAPKEHAEAYINRKGYHSIQLQVVCNDELKFIHCYTGQVGSVHDQRVFNLSRLEDLFTEANFPDDSHLIADAAYAIQKYVMVPYRDNGRLTPDEVQFNFRLSSTRMIVERSLALLKGRFRSLLDCLPMKRTDLIPRYVIACCTLHNICIDHNDLIDIPIIIENDPLQVRGNNPVQRAEGIQKRVLLTQELRAIQ